MTPHFAKLGHGIGLRGVHYDALQDADKPVSWLEAISENYMFTRGRHLERLLQFRRDYPVVLHGVTLGIGNVDPISTRYVQALKTLSDQVEPAWISDHLCWGAFGGHHSHDLLPLPYTEEALVHVVARVEKVQQMLGRRILLENPSTYAQFAGGQMSEWDFLSALCARADCGILLDINNVYVNSVNHHFDAKDYLAAIDFGRVGQIHLAGHAQMGTHLLDTHGAPVADAVWALFQHVVETHGPMTTLIEWDENIPALPRVLDEVAEARAVERLAVARAAQIRRAG